jgi:hypothetical protein
VPCIFTERISGENSAFLVDRSLSGKRSSVEFGSRKIESGDRLERLERNGVQREQLSRLSASGRSVERNEYTEKN